MKKMTLTKLPYWTWSSYDNRDATWWRSLHEVQEHVKETGTLPLIRSKLGSWLDYEKGKKAGHRTVEQKTALKDLLASSRTTIRLEHKRSHCGAEGCPKGVTGLAEVGGKKARAHE